MTQNVSLYPVFLSVAKHSSFSRAAAELYKSQPAVSADIKKLETELGVSLFLRTGKGVMLTEEGRVLAEHAQTALRLIEAGEDKLRELAGLRDGVLKIGASDMTLRFFLLDYIEKFRHLYPGVKLKITNAPTPQSLEALNSGLIDFAVVSGNGQYAEKNGYVYIPVKTVEDIFVASPLFFSSSGLNQNTVTVRELNRYPLIMLEENTSSRKYVYSCLPELKKPDIELATSDLVCEFAARSLGIASVVENFALNSIKNGGLVKLNITPHIPPRPFYVVYMEKLSLSAAALKFISMIKEEKSL